MSSNTENECFVFKYVHDVYPLIDPAPHFAGKTYKEKVVIITGGSTGIGATTALFYAKAGAKIVIVARRVEKLDQCKRDIKKDVSDAQVLLVSGDISDPEVGKRTVKTAVEAWGRIDVVISNHFSVSGGPMARFADKDLAAWWNTQVVSVRGTLNIIHPAIPELLKTKGQVIVTTSQAAHHRIPPLADYSIAKHTLNRFVEILSLDYPELFFCAVHPGIIYTPGAMEALASMKFSDDVNPLPMPETSDTVELPAATFLWLTARNAEFLSGRYVEAPWDLNEVLAKKDEIVKDNLLVTKLAGPAKSV
ncbi:NAD-P-binding protein [Peniophora sp. CONT]|nr:NAD-P-binding protein [Peniophora sp. CONT]